MKTKFLKFIVVCLVIAVSSACENEPTVTSLKKSLNNDVKTLNKAVEKITTSSDFQLLSQNEESSEGEIFKAPAIGIGDFMPNDTVLITLNKISGIYEYAWKKVKLNNPLMRFFTKTAENEYMIVRLPLKKVRQPLTLFWYQVTDSTLTNNFEAKVTDYHVFRNRIAGNEYRLTSDFSINNTLIGSITEQITRNKANGFNSSSVYKLATNYTVSRTENSGDTAVCAYAISEGNKILFEEKLTSIKIAENNKKHREKTHSLTIGNVQIIRSQGLNSLDSAKVYLNGVLQTNSKIEVVINEPDSTNQTVIFAKRDLKITFDDGSSTTLRTLMGNTIENIGKIFRYVQQAKFATNIIDRIAWNIYIRK